MQHCFKVIILSRIYTRQHVVGNMLPGVNAALE